MTQTITPKQAGFFMPAEWHPHQGCWMAWPCHINTWSKVGLERARAAYARVAAAIAHYEPVIILVNPEDEESARTLCGKGIRYLLSPSMTPGHEILGQAFC